VHSYSSRGFPDLPQRYAALRERTPVHLVSLYDLYHHLDGMAIGPRPGERRFLDSGTYEVDSVMNVPAWMGHHSDYHGRLISILKWHDGMRTRAMCLSPTTSIHCR